MTSTTATIASRRPLPPWPRRSLTHVRFVRDQKQRAEQVAVGAAVGVGVGVAAWLGRRSGGRFAREARGMLPSPQTGEIAVEPVNGWVLSGPMATSDATQSGDGAQQGGNGEGGNGGQSPEDVV